MVRPILDVLRDMGARVVRDRGAVLDADAFKLTSMFGGPVRGEVRLEILAADSIVFDEPLELAACGPLWLPALDGPDSLKSVVGAAHAELRKRVALDVEGLSRLGFSPSIERGQPWATASIPGPEPVRIVVNGAGDIVVAAIGARRVEHPHGRVRPLAGAGPGVVQEIRDVVRALRREDLFTSALGSAVDRGSEPPSESWEDAPTIAFVSPGLGDVTRAVPTAQMAALAEGLLADGEPRASRSAPAARPAGRDAEPAAARRSAHLPPTATGAPVSLPDHVRAPGPLGRSPLNIGVSAEGRGSGEGDTTTDGRAAARRRLEPTRLVHAHGVPDADRTVSLKTLSEQQVSGGGARKPQRGRNSVLVESGEDFGPDAHAMSRATPPPHDEPALPPPISSSPGTANAFTDDVTQHELVAVRGPPHGSAGGIAPASPLDPHGEDPASLEARAASLEMEARSLRMRAAELRARGSLPPSFEEASLADRSAVMAVASGEFEPVSSGEIDSGPTAAERRPSAPRVTETVQTGVTQDLMRAALALIRSSEAAGGPASAADESGQVSEPPTAVFESRGRMQLSSHEDVFESSPLHRRAMDSGGGELSLDPATGEVERLLRALPHRPPVELRTAATAADVRLAGALTVGLVVEDAAARERLKRHLSGHFRSLTEAESAPAAAAAEHRETDVFVFVRPRADDETFGALAAIRFAPRKTPPIILVISSDERFDALPEVSLRLPLGQRASEVAQQVLDALGRLGIETVAGVGEG